MSFLSPHPVLPVPPVGAGNTLHPVMAGPRIESGGIRPSMRPLRPQGGRPGQVDFGTFTLSWGRRHALAVVLGYSRLLG